MIQMQSNLFVADNSGARKIQCIKVLGGSKRRFASIGDIIVVSIKDAIPRAKVKKGEVFKAVIVRTSKEFTRNDGSTIRFDNNAAVLLDKQDEPIALIQISIPSNRFFKSNSKSFPISSDRHPTASGRIQFRAKCEPLAP